MNKLTVCFAVVWICIMVRVAVAQDLIWDNIGRENFNLQVVQVHPQDSKIIFAGVPGNIIKTTDAGKSWRNILSIWSGTRNINAIAFNQENANILYAATDNGLYRSKDLGGHWKRIFRGKSYLENQCTSMLEIDNTLFVGTKAGLFISRDAGRAWYKAFGRIGSNTILNIDANLKSSRTIYLAASSGIFKSLDTGNTWELIFAPNLSRINAGELPLDENKDEDEKSSDIRYVKASKDIDLVYFSSAKGIYKSLDQGKTWQKLTEYGLLNRDIKMFHLSGDGQIFALSNSGVFIYQDEHWIEASFGVTGNLDYLVLDDQDNIYIAGEKGMFKSRLKNLSTFKRQELLHDYLKHEPKIRDVQLAAVKFAEVSPDKISQWRNQAAKKALLPQLSVGIDRNSTDLWHWEGGSTTKTDDDILRRGRDSIDWDLTLRWDLSELIWNNDQTSIDVRSRLMVELRNDILDQVNKLYFERLRVKQELDNLAIEDRNKRFDKELKVEELTASLDSLTAGYYSEQLHILAIHEQG
ncbi:MAG: hypothetical protein Q7J37_02385 [Candidatus Omnitrophota bacterium]|nr:hypothetical protein [Candidatus Omnitrophota bacterium]